MKQFRYNISGEYKDWCEIYKGDTLIHNGSLLGVIDEVGDEICLGLNYGTQKYFYATLNKFRGFILAVPKEPDFLAENYHYLPLIFDKQEFDQFVDDSYFDRELLDSLSEVSKKDLINMWLLSNPKRKNYLDKFEMKKDILDNILFFSDDNYVASQLSDMINTSEFSIKPIPDNYELVMIYVDSDEEGIYEWNGLIKLDNRIYLKLDDRYYLNC